MQKFEKQKGIQVPALMHWSISNIGKFGGEMPSQGRVKLVYLFPPSRFLDKIG